eukprot:7783091-Ditylum_brightwellii.AAC.1
MLETPAEWVNENENLSDTDYNEIMECFDGSLRVVTWKYGSDDISRAELLLKKGTYQGQQKMYEDAVGTFVEALRIFKRNYGDKHLD